MQFVLIAPKHKPSFDPDDSDLVNNAVIMEQVVGTLVKEVHGNTGRSEPFLAKSWQASTDGRTWDFFFRDGLTAEDGTIIDAESFSESLTRRLLDISARHDVPAFNRFLGWPDFVSGKSEKISGLRVVDKKHLQMNFSANPSGLLQYLAMSGFGFFSPADFQDGKWKSKQSIVASGAYRVSSFNPEGSIVIEDNVRKRASPKGLPTGPHAEVI